MSDNKNMCGECDHFDPVIRGMKETQWGWCSKKSVYPHKDAPGQVSPKGVARVENPEDLAKPHMVQKKDVKKGCTLYTIKKKKPTKAELLKAATTPKKK